MRRMEVHTTQESDVTSQTATYMNLASCDRFLDSLSNESDYCVTESDLEVANVLDAKGDTKPTDSIDPSPFRPSTVITNFTRGNVQTTTPLIADRMSIHQMAAQGEIVLLQNDLANPDIDINQVDNKGFTALLWTCANGQKAVAELLVQNNANIEARGNNGENALLLASCYGHHEIVRMLLERGMEVNAFDEQGNTSLMFAAYNNHSECIELLLEYGADVTMESEDDLCALDFAVRMGSKAAHQIIEEHLLKLLQGET